MSKIYDWIEDNFQWGRQSYWDLIAQYLGNLILATHFAHWSAKATDTSCSKSIISSASAARLEFSFLKQNFWIFIIYSISFEAEERTDLEETDCGFLCLCSVLCLLWRPVYSPVLHSSEQAIKSIRWLEISYCSYFCCWLLQAVSVSFEISIRKKI